MTMTNTIQATDVTVFSHKSTDYYTPESYVDAAREVMGGIDLDPASDPIPQRWIKAKKYFAPKDDGLTKFWEGRVWLNPPYSKGYKNRSNQQIWSSRLIDFFNEGSVTQAVLLVKAALGYKWFERIFPRYPVCLTEKRIRFLTADGQMPPAKQANAFFYLGPEDKWPVFKRTFEQFGRILMPDRVIISAQGIKAEYEGWVNSVTHLSYEEQVAAEGFYRSLMDAILGDADALIEG